MMHRAPMLLLFLVGVLWLLFAIIPVHASMDLLAVWSGTRLFFLGQNTYDLHTLQQYALSNSGTPYLPLALYNPPPTFLFLYPLVFLTFKQSVLFWQFSTALMVLVSLALLLAPQFSLRRRSIDYLWILVFLVSFVPVITLLKLGQLTAIAMLSFSLAFYLLKKRNFELNSILVGIVLSVSFIKPHLLYLIYFFILLSCLRSQKWKLPLGLALGLILLSTTAFFVHPESFKFYVGMDTSETGQWFQPNVGSWLRYLTNPDWLYLRWIPSIVTVIGIVLFESRLRQMSEDKLYLNILLPLSMLSTPYNWFYDFAFLLPSGFLILNSALLQRKTQHWKISKLIIAILIIANLLMFVGPEEMQYYVWYPLLLLTLELLGLVRNKIPSLARLSESN